MSAPEGEREFIDQILQEHNIRRERVRSYRNYHVPSIHSAFFQHSAPDLEINEELTEMAQQWADKLAKQVLSTLHSLKW